MNVHSIVLQIPLTVANGGAVTTGSPSTAQTVGVWASASRRKSTIRRRSGVDTSYGPWIQVSRLGLPLINEAVIGLQDKDYWNHLTPADDVATFAGYILNPIAVRDAEAIGFYAKGGPLAGCTQNGGTDLESNRTDVIDVINLTNIPTAGAHSIPLTATGDVLRVDLGIPSGFPNGRLLTDEVTSTELEHAPLQAGRERPRRPHGERDRVQDDVPLPGAAVGRPLGQPAPGQRPLERQLRSR